MTNLIPVIAIAFVLNACGDNLKKKENNYHVIPDSSGRLSRIKNDTSRIEIDGLKASPGNFKLLLENEHVRVLQYTLKPGQKDTPHTHPPKSAYVVSGGKLKVYLDDGQTITEDEHPGTASWSEYVGKHSVENIGTTPIVIVLTEIKSLR